MAWVNKFAVLSLIFILHISGFACLNDFSTDIGTLDQDKYRVHLLLPGLKFECCPRGIRPLLEIFCYAGRPKNVVHIWETVFMQINLPDDQYEHYVANTPSEVVAEFEHHRSSWSLSPFTWRRKDIQFNPFNSSCVGISSTHQKYAVSVNVLRVDYWLVIMQLLGVVLFLSASRLSGNPLFFYLCGVSLGICASFLVLVYLVSKLFPKRPLMYGFVVGGWAVGVYFLQMLWENLRVILFQYHTQVLVYCAVTGLVSFVVCYRLGPVTDPRSKNLIQWTLQGVSYAMLYFGSHYHEAAIAMMAVLTLFHNFPVTWTSKVLTYWKRKFPPKVKLLSDNEYHEQGAKETKKALDELRLGSGLDIKDLTTRTRGYCSSPDCNAWKTVLKLKSPVRFAQFMDGQSHLSDQEMMSFENDSRNSCELLTDDSEAESEYDY